MKLAHLFVVLFLSSMACGETDPIEGPCFPEDPGEPEPGRIELGIGVQEFEPLVTDQVVALEQGFQGGHHIYAHARMTDMFPGSVDLPIEEIPKTLFSVFREDGAKVSFGICPIHVAYESSTASNSFDLPQGRVVVLEDGIAPELDGERLRLVVEVVDKNGVYATDERLVIGQLVEMNAL